jgi:osmotically-inducible protein OsmY
MNRTVRTLVFCLVAFLPLAVACDRLRSESTDSTESKSAVALRVRLELLTKLGVDGLRVEVKADGGQVRLAGTVKKRATAELAEEIAGKVDGVTGVRNDIRVEGQAAASTTGEKVDAALSEAEKEAVDALLETKVTMALIDRLGSDGFRIGTDAASGVVTLEFPKAMEGSRRRDAVETAKKVAGVEKVIALDKD